MKFKEVDKIFVYSILTKNTYAEFVYFTMMFFGARFPYTISRQNNALIFNFVDGLIRSSLYF